MGVLGEARFGTGRGGDRKNRIGLKVHTKCHMQRRKIIIDAKYIHCAFPSCAEARFKNGSKSRGEKCCIGVLSEGS